MDGETMHDATKHGKTMHEIVLPERKPALEWILGEAVQKVSPKRRHALVQLAIGAILDAWGGERGDVGTEWRFRLAPPAEVRRPLIPDVAYFSYARMGDRDVEALDAPDIAPDVAVEVLSPDDRRDHVAEKRRVYLACGTQLVLEIDPFARRIDAWDADGTRETSTGPVFSPKRYPDLAIRFDALFAKLDRPGQS